MARPRYLTKTRYKTALECPTKLFYTGKDEYPNSQLEDSFLAALAEGGFQVGELAKYYYPGGHDITTLDYEDAERQTLKLLEQDDVVIFEPAIRAGNLFIRIDILVKQGSHFHLIEVKSKSFNVEIEDPFLNKNGTLSSGWRPYLYDVAFQRHVLQTAYPDSSIASSLMMLDKNKGCPTDGLNQKFRIVRNARNRTGVKVSAELSEEELADKILVKVPVDEFVDMIHAGSDSKEQRSISFAEEVDLWAGHYERDEVLFSEIGSKCKRCEFVCSKADEASEKKSGFKTCWKRSLGWSDSDFDAPSVLYLWNSRKKDKFIEQGVVKIADLTKGDIDPKSAEKSGLSMSERQWMQVEKVQQGDTSPYCDIGGLGSEMASWKFPLHFIDFETTTVAIPFNKGRRPYEGIAFQFSHHVVEEGGFVAHAGEFIHTEPGVFPNYDFVRALKAALEGDEGTIFRYAPHENTILNIIRRQILDDPDGVSDADELCAFIESITTSSGSSVQNWEGTRNMVDMLEMVKRFYYAPYTGGSNSIKYVLPAILNSSSYLQEKYSKPIYGAPGGIPSSNFTDWQWIRTSSGVVTDPYDLLPKLFSEMSEEDNERFTNQSELRDGGAAMIAYARMQFSEMQTSEREELVKGLLRYCELDTFAMVMIYEGWREMVR